MVYPAQIFLFVALVYLVLCSALQWGATRLLRGARQPRGDGKIVKGWIAAVLLR
jgi:polar amino acid transport system permease protein